MMNKLYLILAIVSSTLWISCASDESGVDKGVDKVKSEKNDKEKIDSEFNLMDLEGKWTSGGDESVFEESWKKQDGDMEGMGYSIVEGDTIDIEYLCIANRNGVLSYGALISSQQPETIYFDCVVNTPNKIVFENENHDFPQRIMYEKKGAENMLVTIETMDKTYKVPFDFKKSE